MEKYKQTIFWLCKKIASPNVTVKVKEHHGGEPYLTSTESKAYKSTSKAYKDVFKKEPIPTRDGGSIPIIAQFENIKAKQF